MTRRIYFIFHHDYDCSRAEIYASDLDCAIAERALAASEDVSLIAHVDANGANVRTQNGFEPYEKLCPLPVRQWLETTKRELEVRIHFNARSSLLQTVDSLRKSLATVDSLLKEVP